MLMNGSGDGPGVAAGGIEFNAADHGGHRVLHQLVDAVFWERAIEVCLLDRLSDVELGDFFAGNEADQRLVHGRRLRGEVQRALDGEGDEGGKVGGVVYMMIVILWKVRTRLIINTLGQQAWHSAGATHFKHLPRSLYFFVKLTIRHKHDCTETKRCKI